jgi:D-alanyl-D-alanine carboxypeptidase (penicillin-binding protein 5/6)
VRNGRRLITVVLGGSSGASRNANVEDLLLTGFDVEERRARGETIMVAQNMFEQPPPQHSFAPQTAQGDSDAIDLVLNAAAHGAPVTLGQAGVTQLAATRPGLIAEAPRAGLLPTVGAGAPQAQPRNWSVQVGEFRSGKLATSQVDKVADGFKALFDDHEGQVDHSGRNYRAVFTGFSEAEARNACVTVKAQDLPCEVASR